MISIVSPKRALIISLSLPARRTSALSGEPAPRSVFLKPSPIDSTATKTATTSAMPIVVESDAPSRCGIVRTAVEVTAPTCRHPSAETRHGQPLRKASTMRSRIAWNAGIAPATKPSRTT